jgi:Leucine-rich repeat (LRR) protein
MVNLEYLDVSENRLIKIREFSFTNLIKLKTLNLSHNWLSDDIDSNYLSVGLDELTRLDLSYNDLNYLSRSFFIQFKKNSLSHIYLNNNGLKMMEPFAFESFSSLEYLNLAANSLETIKTNVFYNLNNLTQLILKSNRLTRSPLLNELNRYLSHI